MTHRPASTHSDRYLVDFEKYFDTIISFLQIRLVSWSHDRGIRQHNAVLFPVYRTWLNKEEKTSYCILKVELSSANWFFVKECSPAWVRSWWPWRTVLIDLEAVLVFGRILTGEIRVIFKNTNAERKFWNLNSFCLIFKIDKN